MYTRYQLQLLCLHSSMTMFAVQQIDAGGALIAKRPSETGGLGRRSAREALQN
jgi:hypothetical protein